MMKELHRCLSSTSFNMSLGRVTIVFLLQTRLLTMETIHPTLGAGTAGELCFSNGKCSHRFPDCSVCHL